MGRGSGTRPTDLSQGVLDELKMEQLEAEVKAVHEINSSTIRVTLGRIAVEVDNISTHKNNCYVYGNADDEEEQYLVHVFSASKATSLDAMVQMGIQFVIGLVSADISGWIEALDKEYVKQALAGMVSKTKKGEEDRQHAEITAIHGTGVCTLKASIGQIVVEADDWMVEKNRCYIYDVSNGKDGELVMHVFIVPKTMALDEVLRMGIKYVVGQMTMELAGWIQALERDYKSYLGDQP